MPSTHVQMSSYELKVNYNIHDVQVGRTYYHTRQLLSQVVNAWLAIWVQVVIAKIFSEKKLRKTAATYYHVSTQKQSHMKRKRTPAVWSWRGRWSLSIDIAMTWMISPDHSVALLLSGSRWSSSCRVLCHKMRRPFLRPGDLCVLACKPVTNLCKSSKFLISFIVI